MGFWGAIGGALGRTNDTNVKKEESEFEKSQKYIKEGFEDCFNAVRFNLRILLQITLF